MLAHTIIRPMTAAMPSQGQTYFQRLSLTFDIKNLPRIAENNATEFGATVVALRRGGLDPSCSVWQSKIEAFVGGMP
jgi:hypothetical protein